MWRRTPSTVQRIWPGWRVSRATTPLPPLSTASTTCIQGFPIASTGSLSPTPSLVTRGSRLLKMRGHPKVSARRCAVMSLLIMGGMTMGGGTRPLARTVSLETPACFAASAAAAATAAAVMETPVAPGCLGFDVGRDDTGSARWNSAGGLSRSSCLVSRAMPKGEKEAGNMVAG